MLDLYNTNTWSVMYMNTEISSTRSDIISNESNKSIYSKNSPIHVACNIITRFSIIHSPQFQVSCGES